MLNIILENNNANKQFVYIVYQKDGEGGQEVGAVFSNLDLAQKYVINTQFAINKYYANKTEQWLRNEANDFIYRHLVDDLP